MCGSCRRELLTFIATSAAEAAATGASPDFDDWVGRHLDVYVYCLKLDIPYTEALMAWMTGLIAGVLLDGQPDQPEPGPTVNMPAADA
jgi:hypothetical protein